MVRNLFLASALVLGAAGVAQAQSYPRMVGGGDNAEVVYSGTPNNVVGGGNAQATGGGLDRSYTYGTMNALRGPVGALVGGGDDAQVVYQTSPSAPTVAQRVTVAPRG